MTPGDSDIVNVACGVLMETMQTDLASAMTLLRAMAQAEGLDLVAAAELVVEARGGRTRPAQKPVERRRRRRR